MESYTHMEKRHQEEFNAFPMKFAFSNEQLAKGMKALGLNPSDTDKIFAYGDTGGFYRRSDAPKLHEMLDRHERERQEAMNAEDAADDFIREMFSRALADHEYNYTWDASDALDSLGLTLEAVNANPKLQRGFERACENQKDFFNQ